MKKVIITLLFIAILGGGGYAGAMKYKKNQDKKTVVAVVPVDLMAETADAYGVGQLNEHGRADSFCQRSENYS